jgi:hypothetical protein
MKKLLTLLLLVTLQAQSNPPKNKHHKEAIPKDAHKLIACYPAVVLGYADNHLLLADGSKIVWDDGIKNKSFLDLLDNPDLKDMFSQKYTTGKQKKDPAKNFDPGRIRNEDLFLKIYGASEAKVRANITTITWCPNLVGKKIRVTTVGGYDKIIKQVSDEFDKHPEFQKYLTDIGGTFNWRVIHGTTRHSMHSFGMTMDINTDYSDYWQWTCKCTDENLPAAYVNRIPQGIVDIFEKYKFVWGGKWYHYDTMHFEYRPELF